MQGSEEEYKLLLQQPDLNKNKQYPFNRFNTMVYGSKNGSNYIFTIVLSKIVYNIWQISSYRNGIDESGRFHCNRIKRTKFIGSLEAAQDKARKTLLKYVGD